MNAQIDHIREEYGIYIVIALVVLPFLYYFRKRTVPLILYAVEFAVYAAVMHAFVHGVVALGAWFKNESTFRAIETPGSRVNADWSTPIITFWNREAYNPTGLFYFEVGALVVILLLMRKYRPMKKQKPSKPPLTKDALSRKMAAQAGRTPATAFKKK